MKKLLKGYMLVDNSVSSWFNSVDDEKLNHNILTINGNTAIVKIHGVLTKDWTWQGYAISMVELLKIVRSLETNNTVNTVVYRIDSPGGVAQVIDILSREVANSIKKTVAIVDGMAASGAYWLASQMQEIIVTPLSQVGSIGAAVYYYHPSGKNGKMVKYTSKNAPVKAATGKNKAEVKEIQKRLDSIETEFINAVAAGRRVDPTVVISDYGEGGILLGREAVKVGMVDRIIENYDDIEKELGIMSNGTEIKELSEKLTVAETEIKELSEKLTVAETEAERVEEIVNIDAPGNEGKILAAVKDKDTSAMSVMSKIVAEGATPREPVTHGGDDAATSVVEAEEGGKAASIWAKNKKVRAEFVTEKSFEEYYKRNPNEEY